MKEIYLGRKEVEYYERMDGQVMWGWMNGTAWITDVWINGQDNGSIVVIHDGRLEGMDGMDIVFKDS